MMCSAHGMHTGSSASSANIVGTKSVCVRLHACCVQFQGQTVLVGVDDMDLFKGIELKLMAVERVLDHHPEWRGKLVLIQVTNAPRLVSMVAMHSCHLPISAILAGARSAHALHCMAHCIPCCCSCFALHYMAPSKRAAIEHSCACINLLLVYSLSRSKSCSCHYRARLASAAVRRRHKLSHLN